MNASRESLAEPVSQEKIYGFFSMVNLLKLKSI